MIKYAKELNDGSKRCLVGVGQDFNYYKSLGFTQQEVEQDYKGLWYLSGYAPQQPEEEKKEQKIEELERQIEEINKNMQRDIIILLDDNSSQNEKEEAKKYFTEKEKKRKILIAQIKEIKKNI